MKTAVAAETMEAGMKCQRHGVPWAPLAEPLFTEHRA